MSLNVIYLGPAEALPAAREVLEPAVNVIAPELTAEAVARHLGAAVAIVDASMEIVFDRAMLDKAPGPLAISTATTGADHIQGIPTACFRHAGKTLVSSLFVSHRHSVSDATGSATLSTPPPLSPSRRAH